ncbi:MAG: hypothetical protein R3C59_08060 [Planctomycetaceae bacterium]
MDELQQLIDKLKRVEALHARTTFEGERNAAANVMEAIRRRIADGERIEPPKEYKFSMTDEWSRKLLVALLRRYQIEPYRRYRQRHTTVMARVSRKFVDETLRPEFLDLSNVLEEYLNEVTDRVIRSAIHGDSSDIATRDEPAAIPHLPK